MDWLGITYIAPEIFILCTSMVLLIAGAFKGHTMYVPINRLAVLTLIISIALISKIPFGKEELFNGMLTSNLFIILIKVILVIATTLILLISLHAIRAKHLFFEFSVLMLLALVGMMIMISANDFLSLYMGLEIQSLCLYILAASKRDTVKSSEAGIKYFILGAVASGIFLFGTSLIYGFAGTTNFSELQDIYLMLSDSEKSLPLGILIGMVMVIIAICFKISAAPFHMWAPDVYEGSPTTVTAYFAIVPKIAAMALFIRVLMEAFGGLGDQWRQILITVSVISMFVGAIGAIRQVNIKRLIAYSSIGHVGYILLALIPGSAEGIKSALIYLMIYAVMTAGTFCCIIFMKRNGRNFEDIKSLSGIARTNPAFAFTLSVFMFSMAGIPPLAGFFAKFYVFMAVIDYGLYSLAVLGVIPSAIAAYYYINIVKIMYFDKAGMPIDNMFGLGAKTVLVISCAINILFLLFPAFVIRIAEIAASAVI